MGKYEIDLFNHNLSVDPEFQAGILAHDENAWQSIPLTAAGKPDGKAARALDFPVVSGNVSLYNETMGEGIPPTPARLRNSRMMSR